MVEVHFENKTYDWTVLDTVPPIIIAEELFKVRESLVNKVPPVIRYLDIRNFIKDVLKKKVYRYVEKYASDILNLDKPIWRKRVEKALNEIKPAVFIREDGIYFVPIEGAGIVYTAIPPPFRELARDIIGRVSDISALYLEDYIKHKIELGRFFKMFAEKVLSNSSVEELEKRILEKNVEDPEFVMLFKEYKALSGLVDELANRYSEGVPREEREKIYERVRQYLVKALSYYDLDNKINVLDSLPLFFEHLEYGEFDKARDILWKWLLGFFGHIDEEKNYPYLLALKFVAESMTGIPLGFMIYRDEKMYSVLASIPPYKKGGCVRNGQIIYGSTAVPKNFIDESEDLAKLLASMAVGDAVADHIVESIKPTNVEALENALSKGSWREVAVTPEEMRQEILRSRPDLLQRFDEFMKILETMRRAVFKKQPIEIS